MLSLADLEPEIVCQILEYVNDTSPKTTNAVACVDRYLNEVSKLIAHRHKVIKIATMYGPTHEANDLTNACEQPDIILANIRTITVKGVINDSRQWPVFDEAYWEPLSKFIAKIGKLRNFNWSVALPFPPNVLDALEKRQSASTLCIYEFARATSLEEPEPIEKRLANSTALTHLRYRCIEYGIDEELRELAFRYIVGSAPNLVYAGLLRPKAGHIGRNSDDTSADKVQREEAFKTHKKPNSSVRQLTLDGLGISRETLEDWASIIDLSRLQNVKFSRGTPTIGYFQYASTALPNIKHFSLNLLGVKHTAAGHDKDSLCAAVVDYITTCSPLQSLSLWSWMEILTLPQILQRHGSTLENLQLHEREENIDHRKLLSVEDIKSINNSCPRLKDFTFDLNRTSARLDWKKDINRRYYKELAKFSHLTNLQIYFDDGAHFLQNVWQFEPYDYDQHSEDEDEDEDEDEIQSENEITTKSNASLPHIPPITSSSSSSSPPTSPAAKRHKPNDDEDSDNNEENIPRPSRDTYITLYSRKIWSKIFRTPPHPRFSARTLTLKTGEWEGSCWEYHPMAKFSEWQFRRRVMVVPHERDDLVDEPVVGVWRLEKRGGRGVPVKIDVEVVDGNGNGNGNGNSNGVSLVRRRDGASY